MVVVSLVVNNFVVVVVVVVSVGVGITSHAAHPSAVAGVWISSPAGQKVAAGGWSSFESGSHPKMNVASETIIL